MLQSKCLLVVLLLLPLAANAEEWQFNLTPYLWLPVIDGAEPSRPVFCEHLDGGTVAPRLMLREADFKYVYSPAYPAQLYNLAVDPDELSDLAGRPEFADVETGMRRRVEQNWDIEALGSRVAADQAARRLIDAAHGRGRSPAWDFAPRAQIHNTRYVRRGDSFPDVERRGYLPYPKK